MTPERQVNATATPKETVTPWEDLNDKEKGLIYRLRCRISGKERVDFDQKASAVIDAADRYSFSLSDDSGMGDERLIPVGRDKADIDKRGVRFFPFRVANKHLTPEQLEEMGIEDALRKLFEKLLFTNYCGRISSDRINTPAADERKYVEIDDNTRLKNALTSYAILSETFDLKKREGMFVDFCLKMIASGDLDYAVKIRDYFVTQQESADQLSETVAELCIGAIMATQRDIDDPDSIEFLNDLLRHKSEDALLRPAKLRDDFVTAEETRQKLTEDVKMLMQMAIEAGNYKLADQIVRDFLTEDTELEKRSYFPERMRNGEFESKPYRLEQASKRLDLGNLTDSEVREIALILIKDNLGGANRDFLTRLLEDRARLGLENPDAEVEVLHSRKSKYGISQPTFMSVPHELLRDKYPDVEPGSRFVSEACINSDTLVTAIQDPNLKFTDSEIRAIVKRLFTEPETLIKVVNYLDTSVLSDDEVQEIAKNLLSYPETLAVKKYLHLFKAFMRDHFDRLDIKEPDKVVYVVAVTENKHGSDNEVHVHVNTSTDKPVAIPLELLKDNAAFAGKTVGALVISSIAPRITD